VAVEIAMAVPHVDEMLRHPFLVSPAEDSFKAGYLIMINYPSIPFRYLPCL